MARKGENIYKRKDGRWEGRYAKSRTPEGKIRYGYIYAATHKEAKEKLARATVFHEMHPAEKDRQNTDSGSGKAAECIEILSGATRSNGRKNIHRRRNTAAHQPLNPGRRCICDDQGRHELQALSDAGEAKCNGGVEPDQHGVQFAEATP